MRSWRRSRRSGRSSPDGRPRRPLPAAHHRAQPQSAEFQEARPTPHAPAEGSNPLCGDQIRLEVELDGDRIADIGFQGSGCAISQAAASLMTGAVLGKTRPEAEALFQEVHTMLTSPPDAAGGHGPAREAGRAGRRAALPGAGEVRQSLLAHAACGAAGGGGARHDRVAYPPLKPGVAESVLQRGL